MANKEDLIRAERIQPYIDNVETMREAHPELNWYWDRVEDLLKQIEAYERRYHDG